MTPKPKFRIHVTLIQHNSSARLYATVCATVTYGLSVTLHGWSVLWALIKSDLGILNITQSLGIIEQGYLIGCLCFQTSYNFIRPLGCFSLLPGALQSRDISVSIALGYGLDDRGSRVRFPAGAGNFSLHYRVQNGSGAHPASYLMSKAAGAWSWPLTSI
jgi:hypothetical protein